MKISAIMLTALMVGMALSLIAPVMANPPENKWVAHLKDGDGFRVGQVILNTNDEDDTEAEMYELEVEVEESELANGFYDIMVGGVDTGVDIEIIDGSGKADVYLTSLIDLGTSAGQVSVGELDTDITTKTLWVQGAGKKG
jgi:hypothetical protein